MLRRAFAALAVALALLVAVAPARAFDRGWEPWEKPAPAQGAPGAPIADPNVAPVGLQPVARPLPARIEPAIAQ